MDDHMLDRLYEEIKTCFICAELEKDVPIEDTLDWKSAKILIKAYNSLVKLYYKEEYVKENLLGSVAIEYKKYKENSR